MRMLIATATDGRDATTVGQSSRQTFVILKAKRNSPVRSQYINFMFASAVLAADINQRILKYVVFSDD